MFKGPNIMAYTVKLQYPTIRSDIMWRNGNLALAYQIVNICNASATSCSLFDVDGAKGRFSCSTILRKCFFLFCC